MLCKEATNTNFILIGLAQIHDLQHSRWAC